MDTTAQGQNQSPDQLQTILEKVKNANLPSDLLQAITERIERIALLKNTTGGTGSSNYFIELEAVLTYTNWIIGLPWDKTTTEILDINQAKKVLDENHYGLQGVKDHILEYLASIILNTKNSTLENISHAPILCLVGLAGTGKTTLASSIAQSLGRTFERIPFGGMGSAQALRGQSRAFADAEPGLVIKKLVHAKNKNCVILLDELDRVSEAVRGDIMGVLIELLDPEQNRAFLDHYIDYPFDLSRVLFVTTANNTTNISTAVLDRLEVIQMPSYSDEEKEMIGKNYLFPKIRTEAGLSQSHLTIDDSLWPTIIRPLGFDSGIRSLERTINGICRKVARLIVEGKAQMIHVDNTNLKQFLPT